MLKLTRHLFQLEPSAETMDFYERGLYNHILASQDPATQGIESLKRYGPMMPQVAKAAETEVPGFVCDVKDVLSNIHPESCPNLTFRTSGIGRPRDVTLVPFYKIFDQRYTVYWTVVNR